MERNVVLLDLDGTVLDTAELILGSWRHVRDRFALGGTDAAFRQGMGRPLLEVLGRFARDPDHARELVEAYREHNLTHHDANVRPFTGIPEAFAALRARGVKIGVVTSKHRPVAERGLAVTGLAVDVLIGPGDAARAKPAPDPVLLALERLDAVPEQAAMVGDSPHDIAAGRAAGVHTAAVRWGMFPEDELALAGPDRWLDHPRQLLDLVGEGGERQEITGSRETAPR
jgi:pyrophosphatase PpaX